MDETVLVGHVADDIPTIVFRRCAGKLLFKAAQVQLRVKDLAKRALRDHFSGRAEFGVTEMLHTGPGSRAEQEDDQSAKPVVVHALHERKDGRDSAESIENQGNPARAESAVEKLVMDVVAVRSEDR